MIALYDSSIRFVRADPSLKVSYNRLSSLFLVGHSHGVFMYIPWRDRDQYYI